MGGRKALTEEQRQESLLKRRQYMAERSKKLYHDDEEFRNRSKTNSTKSYKKRIETQKEKTQQNLLFDFYMKSVNTQEI